MRNPADAEPVAAADELPPDIHDAEGGVSAGLLERDLRWAVTHLCLAQTEIDRLRDHVSTLQARSFATIWTGILRRLLDGLSKASPPLPPRIADRFGRSAEKRLPSVIGLPFLWPELHYGRTVQAWERQRAVSRERVDQREAARPGEDPPVVSLLLHLDGADRDLLAETLRSIGRQTWSGWQICMTGMAREADVADAALLASGVDRSRVTMSFRSGSEAGIDTIRASAAALATGTHLACMGHHDLLDRDALLNVVRAFRDRDAAIVYTDEDEIDASGARRAPRFKPDWNHELLLGTNYAGRLTVFDRGLVARAGGFRRGFEGAEEHDLLLRCAALVRGDRIVHVPRILYSRRMPPGTSSVPSLDSAMRAAEAAGRRAVADHLNVLGRDEAVAAGPAPFTYRTVPRIGDAPWVSIVIPTRDRLDLTRATVESIRERTAYDRFDITIVDNGSVEPATLAWLDRIAGEPRMQVRRDDGPFNFSALNNAAIAETEGALVALVNNDIEVRAPDWLAEMAARAIRPDVGCVGAKLLYPDGRIQHGGVVVGMGGVAGHWHKLLPSCHPGYMGRLMLVQEMTAVTGACLVVRRAVYDEVGGLSEALPVDFNDIDFCLKVRAAGYRNLWTPYAELVHHESATRKTHDTPEKAAQFDEAVAYMKEMWGTDIFADPSHNPNLARRSEAFALGPPRW